MTILCQGPDKWQEPDDIERFNALPPDVLQTIIDHRDRLVLGEPRANMACIWFDPSTRRCRRHEHRPQICRDFDIGSDGCRKWRQRFRVYPY